MKSKQQASCMQISKESIFYSNVTASRSDGGKSGDFVAIRNLWEVPGRDAGPGSYRISLCADLNIKKITCNRKTLKLFARMRDTSDEC